MNFEVSMFVARVMIFLSCRQLNLQASYHRQNLGVKYTRQK
ncbi:hypothetical protein N44_04452 [Microcystis aeruginosa NIES-44]|uniref:Uncharacterized protein n=1 Tax=Microcystis aeruginosa NIES-44 TaxID=449439 RepID=A0A0A1W243_MICAE|nr:hypothetical protein N44_04452 [Microcystis aeruginosa NIES-44]